MFIYFRSSLGTFPAPVQLLPNSFPALPVLSARLSGIVPCPQSKMLKTLQMHARAHSIKVQASISVQDLHDHLCCTLLLDAFSLETHLSFCVFECHSVCTKSQWHCGQGFCFQEMTSEGRSSLKMFAHQDRL